MEITELGASTRNYAVSHKRWREVRERYGLVWHLVDTTSDAADALCGCHDYDVTDMYSNDDDVLRSISIEYDGWSYCQQCITIFQRLQQAESA